MPTSNNAKARRTPAKTSKDLKRLIRARMAKTGESYTAARAVLTERRERAQAADYAATAGMSDAAVAKKTGKDWRGWVDLLDGVDAVSMPHKDIARLLMDQHGVPAWWAQMITVAYERIRGLRDKGQRRGGKYDVNKSKAVPVAELYAAFAAKKREQWLGEVEMTVRTARRNKSMRIVWDDDTPVDVYFSEKGPAKSQVQLQHRELPSKAKADRARAFWTERLAALARFLS